MLIQKAKAKGIPQYIVDKLELPVLPANRYWKLKKKNIFTGHSEVSLMQIRRFWLDKRLSRHDVLKLAVLERDFQHAANRCLNDIRRPDEVDRLWEK